MKTLNFAILLVFGSVWAIPAAHGQEFSITLEAAREQGRQKSRFLKETKDAAKVIDSIPKANVGVFQESVEPVLNKSCLACHGPEKSEGRLRIDQQYLDAVRDTELKLAKAQKWIDTPIPQVDTRNLHLEAEPKEARLYFQTMYELIYLAFLSDSTRVATFQLGRENGEGPHDLLSLAVGLNGAHGLTHEVKNPGGWENLGTYNRYQAEEFGRFAQRLKETPEPTGAGNMLDNTLAMHGSASSSFHLSRNYPIISAGGKNLGFTNGRYLKFGTGNDDNQAGAGIDTDAGWQSKQEVEELPLGKLFVTILQRLGVETDSFGGQTGSLSRV